MRYVILLSLIVCVLSLPGTKEKGIGTKDGAGKGKGHRDGNGHKRPLNKVPPVFKLTNPAGIIGKWFVTYVRNPGTWRVADQFQEWNQKLTYDPIDQNFVGTDIYSLRGECIQVPFNISTPGRRGVFEYIHGQGDVISGHVVIVDTDFTSYLILWGCTRASLFFANVCEPENYWLQVLTRSANPDAATISAVNSVLKRVWGTSITKIPLITIPQSPTSPCIYDPSFEHAVGPDI